MADVETLWSQMAATDHPGLTVKIPKKIYDFWNKRRDSERIFQLADDACRLKFPLIGAGVVEHHGPINWHKDLRSGAVWPRDYFRDIDILDLGADSDVRIAWELSRLQWLIPAAQAHILSHDERYARFVRDILEDWISANPYGRGANWAVAMEPAMRAFTWGWFFHVFKETAAWSDPAFREHFAAALYRHGVFVDRHREDFGVSGNHLVADGAALAVLGILFGGAGDAGRWLAEGWEILCRESERQVMPDGVSFEASMGYHRLTLELLYWAAAHRLRAGLEVPERYRSKLRAMVRFCEAATRADGSVPQWGDSDDGRVLPFGDQPGNDFRYLSALVARLETLDKAMAVAPHSIAEAVWGLGLHNVKPVEQAPAPASAAFTDMGIFVMAGARDHVFIDCGPVGFAGLGGHGHNDCLAIDVMLDGVPILTDSGTYAYSGDVAQRNAFRGSAFHNTPIVDDEEQNRFVAPDELWRLHDDAAPTVRRWQIGAETDVFEGSHSGYRRLARPVTPVRLIALDKSTHRLLVRDQFEGDGEHRIAVPFHLPPAATVADQGQGVWRIDIGGSQFCMVILEAGAWTAAVTPGWISPAYGVRVERPVLQFSRDGAMKPLTAGIGPATDDLEGLRDWVTETIAGLDRNRDDGVAG